MDFDELISLYRPNHPFHEPGSWGEPREAVVDVCSGPHHPEVELTDLSLPDDPTTLSTPVPHRCWLEILIGGITRLISQPPELLTCSPSNGILVAATT